MKWQHQRYWILILWFHILHLLCKVRFLNVYVNKCLYEYPICHLQSGKKTYLFRLGFCHYYSPQRITVKRTNIDKMPPTRFTDLRPPQSELANIPQHYKHDIITLSKTSSSPTLQKQKLWCVDVKDCMLHGIRDRNLKKYHWYKSLTFNPFATVHCSSVTKKDGLRGSAV